MLATRRIRSSGSGGNPLVGQGLGDEQRCHRVRSDGAAGATTLDTPGSRAVLTRAGFVPTGGIQPDGRPGMRDLKNLP